MAGTTLMVGIDAGPAQLGARRLEQALSGIRRGFRSTGREIESMTAQVAGAGDAVDQVANDYLRAEAAYEKMVRRSMALGKSAGQRGSNGNLGLAEPDALLNMAQFSRRRRIDPLEIARMLVDVADFVYGQLHDPTADVLEQIAQQEMESAQAILNSQVDEIRANIRAQVDRLSSAHQWAGLIIDDVRSNVFQLRNTQFDDDILLTAFPDAESMASHIAGIRRDLDDTINRATSELFSGEPYNIENPPNDALYPESWFARDPGNVPHYLLPSFQPPRRSHQTDFGSPPDDHFDELLTRREPQPQPAPTALDRRLDLILRFHETIIRNNRDQLDRAMTFRDYDAAREARADIVRMEDRFPIRIERAFRDFVDDEREAAEEAERYLRALEAERPMLGALDRDPVFPRPSLADTLRGQPDQRLFRSTGASAEFGMAPTQEDLATAREARMAVKRRDEQTRLSMVLATEETAVINDQAMAIENLAMVNAGGAVSALANADAVLMQTEAYRAQAETVDGSFTPATKGAAEATLELADAAVGLDDALKAPDPAAMAEDMEELSALGQQVGNSFASAFERAVFSGEELSDVLSALALDLARLVLQQQVLGPLAGGVGGLFDDILGGIGSLFGGTPVGKTAKIGKGFHSGGLVSHGASLGRGLSPTVWLGAARYHFGGLAGDEVPAILRRGEEVLTRDDPRHRANGGLGGGRAGGGVAIHQTISIDAKAVNENGVDGAAADAVGRQMRAAVRSAVQAEIAQQSRVGGMLNRV